MSSKVKTTGPLGNLGKYFMSVNMNFLHMRGLIQVISKVVLCFDLLLSLECVSEFPVAAVKDQHPLSGLKQHTSLTLWA